MVWNRLLDEQPRQRRPPAAPDDEPDGAGALCRDTASRSRAICRSIPGNDIPFGGPQKLLQLYQDQTWLKGKHDIRFGGSYVHIADDRTFCAYSNAVEALNTTSSALTSLDNFVRRPASCGSRRRSIRGLSGRHLRDAGAAAELHQQQPLQRVRALRATTTGASANRLTVNLGLRYEYYGPQNKSDPKYDSNFYYGDPNVVGEHGDAAADHRAVRRPARRCRPTRARSARCGSPTGTTGRRASALRGTSTATAGPASAAATAWPTSGTSATSPTTCCSTRRSIWSRRSTRRPTCRRSRSTSTTAVRSPASPGVDKTIPGGSLRHVDQNIKTAYAHLYGVSFQKRDSAGHDGRRSSTTARPAGSCTTWPTSTSAGAALVYTGIGTATSRPNPQYAAFNTRGNRGQSQYQRRHVLGSTRAQSPTPAWR